MINTSPWYHRFYGPFGRVADIFRARFLRKSFLLTLVLVILLPIHAFQVTYPSFRNLLTRFTEENAIRVANHMASSVVTRVQNEAGSAHALVVTDAFKSAMAHVAEAFHLYKYRLFDASGRILHSSVQREVGTLNEHAYFHDVVAKGQPLSMTVQKDHRTMENETFKLDVVETYVPIMQEGQFLGAFEIYFDITPWRKQVDWVVTLSSLVLFAMVALFFLVVLTTRFHVVRRVGEFMQSITEAARGDFHRQIKVAGRDELTDMAVCFNAMGKELLGLHKGLQDEHNKLTTIILSAREGIVVTDWQGKVVLINPAAERLLQKSAEQIVQEGFLNLLDDPVYLQVYLEKSGIDVPTTVVHHNRVLNVHANTIHTPDGLLIGSAALFRDVTEEKRLEKQLRIMSNTDSLTGLYNRRFLDETLCDEFSRSKRYHQSLAVLMLDIDHFKRFNDEHGHDQGDRILQAVAGVLQHSCRDVDFPCRYGGEEFCLILPNTALEGAKQMAERLRVGVERMRVDDLQVTISLGVAVYPLVGDCPVELQKAADEALYQAKRAGRNRYCVVESDV
ncbi:MAG: diguanylate cyclase [Magnetococcales bacterium]|nr:diguanylate cyclase [Magnetococcales bacterium]